MIKNYRPAHIALGDFIDQNYLFVYADRILIRLFV